MQRQAARINLNRRRGAGLALVLGAAVTLLACGSLSSVSSVVSSAATGAAAISSQPAARATRAQSAGAFSSAQCQKVGNAFLNFEGEYPLLGLASDGAYASNTPDSPAYIDIPRLRSDMDLMATLPDATLGSVSASIAQFRALIDQVDANFKAGGAPFSDGSGNGQKVVDEYLKLAGPYTVVAEAFGTACPDYSAATAAPDQAGFQIGQTASVGDLRVTLDSVSEPPMDGGALPTVGNRFLLLHVTIQNAGTASQQVTGLVETNIKDSAGASYGYDPFANSLPAATGDNGLDAQIAAGATHAGVVAYQLPAEAGDLLWFFHDYGGNQAVFAIKASDIDVSGASSAPTAEALRAGADATMTEFYSMAATVEAADMTATP